MNYRRMFAMHVDDEDKKLNDKTSSSFGQRGATIINESDFYSLVLASRLPNVKKFKGILSCTIYFIIKTSVWTF